MSDENLMEDGLKDIVIGLVAPIGTDLDPVCTALSESFEGLGYNSSVLRLSQYLDEVKDGFKLDLEYSDEKIAIISI